MRYKNKSNEIQNIFADNFEKWKTEKVRCKRCGYEWIAVSPEITQTEMLQCKNCGQQGFTEINE